MKSSLEIAWQARKILQETGIRCPQYADKLNGMHIDVSSRMTRAAGKARYRGNLIRLSLPYFASEANFEHLHNTVTHEAAHLIAGPYAKSHGIEWQLIHRSMGGNGETCHEFALADGFHARRYDRKEVICFKCGRGLKLGPTQYNKHMRLTQAGHKGYMHKACPSTLRVLE